MINLHIALFVAWLLVPVVLCVGLILWQRRENRRLEAGRNIPYKPKPTTVELMAKENVVEGQYLTKEGVQGFSYSYPNTQVVYDDIDKAFRDAIATGQYYEGNEVALPCTFGTTFINKDNAD